MEIEKEKATTEAALQVRLHRIYTKNSLFESASVTPASFEKLLQPIIDLQVFANVHPQDKEVHEAVLTLHITAKHNDSLLWQVKFQQAGLYTLQGFNKEQQDRVLNGFCMNQIYPHACATLAQLVTQGGFTPIYLQPMDFEKLYQEQKLKESKTETEASTVN